MWFFFCLFDKGCVCWMYKNVEKETEVVKHVDQISSKIGLSYHFKVFFTINIIQSSLNNK